MNQQQIIILIVSWLIIAILDIILIKRVEKFAIVSDIIWALIFSPVHILMVIGQNWNENVF